MNRSSANTVLTRLRSAASCMDVRTTCHSLMNRLQMRVEEPEALVLASTSQAGTASGWATARTAASVTAAWGSRA